MINQTAKPCFAIHKRVGPYHIAWHDHSHYQLLYAEGGVVYLETPDQKYILPARHGAWIPGNLYHRIESQSPHLHLRMLFFAHELIDDPAFQELKIFPISTLAREMITYTETWKREDAPKVISAL